MNKRINNKGFTLIELLATILVLAIIMMIAYPKIRKVIDESKRSAFLTTAKGILKSTDNYYGLKNSVGGFTPDLVYDLASGDTIKFTGGDFKTGEVKIDRDGNTALAIWDGTYCIVKDFDDENNELTIVKNKTGANCDIENVNAIIHYGTTGYLCADPGSTVATEAKYFVFNQATKTITGYDTAGPKDVVIPCTIGGVNVENIGTSAFASKVLTSVIMPDTILTIGSNAFLSNQITTLSLGNSVTTIGYGAFRSNKITTVLFPDSLKVIENAPSWPDGAFSSNPITNVSFGKGIVTIGIGAFSFTDKLLTIDFSRSINLTTIADCAFIYSGLIEVDLSKNTKLSIIGEHAFKYDKITELSVYGDNLNIKAYAFESNLISNLDLKGKIISIGNDAFKNNQLPDSQAFVYGRNSNGDLTSTLVSYAGANRSSIVIPNSVTSLANASFSSLGLNGLLNTGNGLTLIEANKFSSNSLTNLIIGSEIVSIGSNAFLSNQITSLNLGNKIETIGYGAFRSNKLTTLILPDSLRTIENAPSWPDGTFASNPITSTTFGSGILTIGIGAFAFTDKLVAIDFSKAVNLTTIADCAFIYSSPTEVDLSNSIKLSTIGEHAFKYGKITNLKIYGDNLNIKAYSFENNLISNLELSGKITTIGNDAFKNNQLPDNQAFIYGRDVNGNQTSTLVSYGGVNRSNITIPDSVTSLTNASFSGLGLSGTLNTGNGLTSVENSKFSTNSLTNVIIGNAVTSIGMNAFLSNQIATLNLGNSVTTIGYGSFKSNKITSLTLPNSLKTIENAPSWPDGTFANNLLTNVTFGTGIEVIGYGAFSSNNALVSINTSQATNLETIADCAFLYSNLTTLDLRNSTKLSIIGEHAFKYAKITDLKIYGDDLNIKAYAFESNLISNLELTGRIINIGADAFKNNQLPDNQAFIYGKDINGNNTSSLVSYAGANRSNIIIPDSVTGLTNASFSSLGLSGSLNTGNGLTSVETSKFSSNALTNLVVGNSVTTIGANAFVGNQIASLTLGNSVTTIGYSAFKSNRIVNLVFPDSLKTIESPSSWPDGAFANNLLTSVTFGTGIEFIGSGAFYGNSNLATIDFSRTTKLHTIAACAFYNGALINIEIPTSVLTIGDSAFRTSSPSSTILIKGKINSTNFTSLGSNWYGTATITYELSSCYTYSGNMITDYNSICSKSVEIPTTLGGNTITTIGANAFTSKGLTKVVISNSITNIGNNAFSGNSIDPIIVMNKTNASDFISLGTNWNNGSKVIYDLDDASCFTNNSNIVSNYYDEIVCPKNMVIPNGVTEIATNAFVNKGLNSVTIPSSLTTIGNTPFTGNLLSSMTVNSGTNFTSLGTSWNGNVLKVNFLGTSIENNCYNVTGNSITKYQSYCPETVVIPASVEGTPITSLAANSFKGSAVRYITIPSTITSIGNNAFEGNDIVTLSLVSGLDTIGASAFKDTGLLTLTLPNTVENVGAEAFKDNAGLTVINVQGKTSASDFTSLGTGWNGSCSNIVYLGN